MPVGMLQTLQGVTKEQYDQVNEKMFGQSPPPADKAPDGLIVHSAGPTQGGWYIYDIWESKDHRSEEHTSELQSRRDLVCRLLLEKKKKKNKKIKSIMKNTSTRLNVSKRKIYDTVT